MRIVRCALMCGLVLSLVGCSGYKKVKLGDKIADSPIVVEATIDEDADFSAYGTWNWLPGAGTHAGSQKIDDTYFSSTTRTTIDGRLFEKGYKRVPENPDLYVNIYLSIDDITESYIEEKYAGFYEPEYRVDLPEKDKKKRREWQEGTLFIFVFDAKTREAVWFASAQAEIAPELVAEKKSEARLAKAIDMMMEKFPKRPDAK